MTFTDKYDENVKPAAPFDLLGFTLRLTFPILVIATGVFFLFAQRDPSLYSSQWWVMYPAIVGLGLLVGAVVAFIKDGQVTFGIGAFVVVSFLLLLVSIIMFFDPTWSFTRSWDISLFQGVDWNVVWPVVIIAFGLLLLVPMFFRRHQ
jgi:hypothetical protein